MLTVLDDIESMLLQEVLGRVEILIPNQDVRLVKLLAGVLQGGGRLAYHARNALNAIIPKNKQNIVDFFHQSPLAEFAEELDLTRDNDTGNPLQIVGRTEIKGESV